MYEYACPKCHLPHTVADLEAPETVACGGCGQRLYVVPEEQSAASLMSGERLAPLPARAPWWGGPWAVVAGGALGSVGAAALVGAWLLVSPGPGKAPEGPVAEAAPPAKEGRPEGKRSEVVAEKKRDGSEEQALSAEEVYKRALRSSAWIVCDSGGKRWTGSGTLVDARERLVLTNEHVANGTCDRIRVLFPLFKDGELVRENDAHWKALATKGLRARLVKADRARDLALIQIEDDLPEGVAAARVAARSVGPAQLVRTVGGNPRGSSGQWVNSSGEVRQVCFTRFVYDDSYPRGAVMISTTVPINQGDSGGGLLDARAALVGVNAMFKSDSRSNSYHIDVVEVHDFLAGCYRQLGKTWEAPSDEPGPADKVKVAELVKRLQSAIPQERVKTARELAGLGTGARSAVPALVKLLRSPGEPAAVRSEAQKALGEIGAPSREEVGCAVEALRDAANVDARRWAADALGKVGGAPSEEVAALVAALKDGDLEVRRSAAASLGRLGKAVRGRAEGPLREMLRAPEQGARQAAFGALAKVGPPDRVDVAEARRMLRQRGQPGEVGAYACLLLLSAPDDEAPPALAEALTADADPMVAVTAVLGLAKLKGRTKEVGLGLARALGHRMKVVRVTAAQGLAVIGFDLSTFPAFVQALDSSDEEVRRAVADKLPQTADFARLAQSDEEKKALVGPLKTGLASRELGMRSLAALALDKLGPGGASAAPALLVALRKESNQPCRMQMLLALGEMGPDGMAALSARGEQELDYLAGLTRDLRSANKAQAAAAAVALARLAPDTKQGKEALPVVARALLLKGAPVLESLRGRVFSNGKPAPFEQEVHERAKAALVKVGAPAAGEVVKAYRSTFIGRPTDPTSIMVDKAYARKVTFEVLAKIGVPAQSPALKKLFSEGALFRGDAQEVIDAAKEAKAAVYPK